MNTLRIGLVSISDRASSGVYQDKGIPALEEWLTSALTTPFELETRLIPDEQAIIEQTLCELVDEMSCHLVLTTGGTGPARRDVTPDATLAVADREMPGFGEQMRQISLHFVPTAILSRQVGVIRKQALILNLPGQPKSIKETLEGVKDVIPALQDTIVRDASYAPNPANSELYRDLFMKKVKLVKQDMREAFKTLRSMKSFR